MCLNVAKVRVAGILGFMVSLSIFERNGVILQGY